MQGSTASGWMLGDIVSQRGYTAFVLTHQLTATVSEQQGGFQSKHP